VSRCYKVFLREKGSGILGTLWKGKLGEREFMTDIAQRNIVRVTKVGTNDINFGSTRELKSARRSPAGLTHTMPL
jgi:hypothetical protein